MGALAPIGYIVPGLAIDLILWVTGKLCVPRTERMVLANGIAAPYAALTANLIVFRLSGIVLALYLCVLACSGIACGFLGAKLTERLIPVIGERQKKRYQKESTVI